MDTITRAPVSARPIEILLVDDDDDDVRLAAKTLEHDRVLAHLHRAEDGVEAVAFLERSGPYTDAPRPDLILLDLNMPRMDGRQVLQRIKQDPDLKTIPVVVLTSSDDEADIAASYAHQANSYITKPVDLMQFRSVLRSLKRYWFTIVALPNPV